MDTWTCSQQFVHSIIAPLKVQTLIFGSFTPKEALAILIVLELSRTCASFISFKLNVRNVSSRVNAHSNNSVLSSEGDKGLSTMSDSFLLKIVTSLVNCSTRKASRSGVGSSVLTVVTVLSMFLSKTRASSLRSLIPSLVQSCP